SVRIDPAGLRTTRLDPVLCARIRASVLLAAPLLSRTGRCDLPPPGGDVIGRRRLDTHLLAFRSLGAEITMERDIALVAHRLRAVETGFSRPGSAWEITAGITGGAGGPAGTRLRVPPNQELRIQDDLGAAIPKIDDGPWPQFPADLTSIAVAVATQAHGVVL